MRQRQSLASPPKKLDAVKHQMFEEDDEEERLRNERGCAPSNSHSKMIIHLLGVFGIIFLLFLGFLFILHNDLIPSISSSPSLQPLKNFIAESVQEWHASNVRAALEVEKLNAEYEAQSEARS